MKQKMTASNDGSGEKWSRTTEAEEDGREIFIEESADQIRVAIKDKTTQRETVTIAKTAEELNKKNSTAYETYRKYAGDNKRTGKAVADGKALAGGKIIAGGKAFGDAKIFGDGNGFPDLKAFGDLKGFGDAKGIAEGFGKAGGGDVGDAVELLKQQIRELKQQADIQGTPLEGLLDELEQQVEQAK